MIHSMTGFGAAECTVDGVTYAVEIRCVNGRFLKLAIKLPDAVQFAETAIDKQLRGSLARGSVSYTLRMRSAAGSGLCSINLAAAQEYVDQLMQIRLPEDLRPTIDLGAIAQLPGVCQSNEINGDVQHSRLVVIADITTKAVDGVQAMRRDEGQALARELAECCAAVRTELKNIAKRAPNVVDEYHDRLKSRVELLMQKGGFELEADGLMREVAIYAERSDIGEELTRLNSHLDQFAELCQQDGKVGRTLDFLTQELLREANTIASKSNDTLVARSVVEIKKLIDRLKEQVQNVE